MRLLIPIVAKPFNLGKAKLLFLFIGILCSIVLLCLKYDEDFRITSLLPIFYVLMVVVFVDTNFTDFGIGALCLVGFYSFRMCIFPVVLALGNFYFEPSKSLYINYYAESIYLMCFETFVVFLSAGYFIKKYKRTLVIEKKCLFSKHSLFYCIFIFLTFIPIATFYLKDIDYYHFITEESVERFVVDEIGLEKQSGFFWFLSDYLSGLWRPLFSFLVISLGATYQRERLIYIVGFVALINMLFLSDRRVFALTVSVFTMIYFLNMLASKNSKFIIEVAILSMGGVMAYYFLNVYAQQGGIEMIARSVQRYFSGPSLSALALAINNRIGVVPGEFFSLLHNDFKFLVGFFGYSETHDYVGMVFWPSKGIWTPFIPGAIRYFGILFPFPLIFCVWSLIKWDSLSRKTSDLFYSMIYSYIAFSIAFYLIMYSIELVFYFIVATGLIMSMMIYYDKRFKIKIR